MLGYKRIATPRDDNAEEGRSQVRKSKIEGVLSTL